jgi:hypothetical protein
MSPVPAATPFVLDNSVLCGWVLAAQVVQLWKPILLPDHLAAPAGTA